MEAAAQISNRGRKGTSASTSWGFPFSGPSPGSQRPPTSYYWVVAPKRGCVNKEQQLTEEDSGSKHGKFFAVCLHKALRLRCPVRTHGRHLLSPVLKDKHYTA
eukprot:705746-Pelagomonas_calceolata.AAC.3